MRKEYISYFILVLFFPCFLVGIYSHEDDDPCELTDTLPRSDGFIWIYNANQTHLENRTILYPARKTPGPWNYYWPIAAIQPTDNDTQNDCCHWDGHLSREWIIDNPGIGASLKPILFGPSPHFYKEELIGEVAPFSIADGFAPLECIIWNYDSNNNNYGPCPYNEGQGESVETTIEFIDLCVEYNGSCMCHSHDDPYEEAGKPVIPVNEYTNLCVLPDSNWPKPVFQHNGQLYKYDWKWGFGWTKHVYTNHPILDIVDIMLVDPNFCGEEFLVDAVGDRGDSDHHEIFMEEKFTMVGIEKVQIRRNGNWIDINKPNVYLNKGVTYRFRAIKRPSNASWPSGYPIWTGASNGIGEEIDVTINEYGGFPLTVSCGASQKNMMLWTYYVEVEPEDQLTECMERRHVTFYATVTPQTMPVAPDYQMKFTFHYETAEHDPWTAEVYSNTTQGNHTAVADDVPDGSPGHKFTTPIFVDAEIGGATATSSEINIDVYELWINNPTNYYHADYGKDFNSDSIHSDDCNNYLWSMPDGWPDIWALSGSVNSDHGNLYVKEGAGSHLGDTTTLKLECKDGESNNHSDTKFIFVDGIYAVMSVKFDYDTGSIQDGQNARINATQNITQPEWIYMADPTPTTIPTPTPNPNFPSVYAGNQTGQLQARFSFTYGTSGKSFIVYAEGSGDGLFGGKGPLGDLNDTPVDDDQYKTFTTSQNTPDVIKKQSMDFKWFFKSSIHSDVEPLNFRQIYQTNNHVIYIVASQPQGPFIGSGPNDGVWTTLLDKLCDDDWCGGMDVSSKSDIVSKITQNTNDSGFHYQGGARFANNQYSTFDLTGCINGFGSGSVNCSDCAYIVSVFSRSLGIGSGITAMVPIYGQEFLLNWIKPIGGGWTNNPFNTTPRSGFSYHHFSTFPNSNTVYDACLDLDGDSDATSQPNIELNVFGLDYPTIYKQKLVDPGDLSNINEICYPNPETISLY